METVPHKVTDILVGFFSAAKINYTPGEVKPLTAATLPTLHIFRSFLYDISLTV